MNKSLKIGLLGLGTVGAGVPLILEENKWKIESSIGMPLIIEKVFVRSIETKQEIASKYQLKLTTDIADILEDKTIDIVIEVMGGVSLAKTAIEQAIKNKKHVVTANKDLIAQHGDELSKLAQKNNVFLYYEASVAGGIPILRTLATSLSGDEVTSVKGIINGTTNFMLTQMGEKDCSYDEALLEAQRLGYAEADPTNDVEGIDAAYKLIILAKFAVGMSISIEDIGIKGIANISLNDIQVADKFGYKIKLVGNIEKIDTGIAVEVSPVLVPKYHPLGIIENEMNGILLKSNGIGESFYYGPGAGERPTATSIVSDLIAIGKNDLSIALPFNTFNAEIKILSNDQLKSQYFLALESDDPENLVNNVKQILTIEEIITENFWDESRNCLCLIIQQTINESMLVNLNNQFSKKGISVISHYKVL